MAEEDNTGGGCDVSASPDVTVSFPGEKEFECKICNNCFDLDRHTRKVLECSHTFCRQCLDALQSQEGGGWRVGCPVCQHQTPMPEDEPADPSDTDVPIGPVSDGSTTPRESSSCSCCNDTCRQVGFVTSCVFALLSFLGTVGFVYIAYALDTSQNESAMFAPFFWLVGGVLACFSSAFLSCVISLSKHRPCQYL